MKSPTLSSCHLVTLSVLALALPALAADTPATIPAPAPTTAPAPIPTFTTPSRDYRSSRYSRDSRSYSRDSYVPRTAVDDGSGDILLRKSIFAKDRRPALVRDSGPPRDPTPTSTRPPSIPILIGVMREDTGYVAYIQDPDSGTIWPFAAGDPLPGDVGTVQDLTLDYMDIAKPGPENNAPLRILIGQNLAGKTPDIPVVAAPSAPAAAAPSDSSATTAPSTSAAPTAATIQALIATPADTSGLSLEERMKLRAKQQRGQ